MQTKYPNDMKSLQLAKYMGSSGVMHPQELQYMVFVRGLH